MIAAAVLVLSACGGAESAETADTVAADVTETSAGAVAPSTTDAPSITSATGTTVTVAATETTVTVAATETTQAPMVDPTCDWESARLSSGDVGSFPTGEGGDLSQAVLGSWQHTHIDEGSGFVPLKPTTDIRFVLSGDTFLYCQDVKGATKQSENSAALNIEGAEIILPSPATGYEVVAWNDDMMVWLNHRDNSLYLLQRR